MKLNCLIPTVLVLLACLASSLLAQTAVPPPYSAPPTQSQVQQGPPAYPPSQYPPQYAPNGDYAYQDDGGGCACGNCGGGCYGTPCEGRACRPLQGGQGGGAWVGCGPGEGGRGLRSWAQSGGCEEGCGGAGFRGPCERFGPDCGTRPRWFNVDVEFMLLTREEVSSLVEFSTGGSRDAMVGDPFEPVNFSTNNLGFTESPGVRVTGQFICGPGSDMEVSYFGTFFWDDDARVTGADSLYSIFSDFGVTPAGGFADTDAANVHTLSYSTRFDSGEWNYRRRYISPNARIQTSLLAGVRYVRLDEQFLHTTSTDTNGLSYDIRSQNDLVGVQLGGDLTISVSSVFTIGGEFKAGAFMNEAQQQTSITTDLNALGTVAETASRQSEAFVGEVGVFALLLCTEHITLRGGYQLVYLDSVALAPEQFNPTRNAMTGSFANRLPTLDDTGNAFYHGLTAGCELTW